ncbi:MAG: MmgE/PrpD family protein [Deltaproteobacteria bacterium]|nr:MmgE/PrpD family protein [Deltaproteobacteria bacterium]
MDFRACADWSRSLDPAALPPGTAERARLQLASVLASLLDGLALPDVAASRAAWAGEGVPRRKGGRGRAEPPAFEALAAWFATASIALDHDDYLLFGHPGHSAAGVPLAWAAAHGTTLGEALAAAVAADELAARLGGYTLVGPHNGQTWTHIHLAGAVLAAGRLAGDDAEVVARALGLAFANPPFLLPAAFFGGSSKLLCAAVPVRQGLQALRLARAGRLAAPPAVLDAEDGLGRHFAHAALEGFFDGLGEVWLTDTLAVKRVPGCAYVSAAAEAAADVARQFERAKGRRPVAEDVERLELSVTALTVGMEDAARPHRSGPLSPVEVNFSAPLTTALALLDGDLEPRSFDPARLARDEAELRRVAARVVVRHDFGRTLRLVDGVVRPMALLDAFGDLRGDTARKAGWELLRRYPGVLRGGGEPRGATRDDSPFARFGERGTFEALRAVGQLVKGALGRRREGTRYTVRSARPADVRFAASAGLLATLAGEAFAGECEVPPGAPGAAVDLTTVVREKLARSFRDAGIEAAADELVGRLLGAPLEAPLGELFAPAFERLLADG